MPIPSRLKRTRSVSDASEVSLPSDSETESGVSREAKNSIYRHTGYNTLMASKGSFMHDSSEGPSPEEVQAYTRLLTETTPLPADPLFELQYLEPLCALLEERSELRVCIDLHPRLVPSAEILGWLPAGKFKNLVEGHNDRWLDATVLFQKLPQPHRTVAYRPSAFTEEEQRKLDIVSKETSTFIVRTGMMFPFFTCEVKCGKEGLNVADRANTNSMTIALRMVVDPHRKANNVMAVHRKILGFSISHDGSDIRVYGHYPEVDGDLTRYFRRTIRKYACTDKGCEDMWTSYRFFWNVCDMFAHSHLQLIKEAIRRLPDSQSQAKEREAQLAAQHAEIINMLRQK
ncbi:hypothetical protein H2198_004061 [Neophaeococcomyces mojaviensis]|uniref:Uncharacterized protein n=1 Tax=Neophaeococcomyces mojaviensis TaxID=3383035 RepID=A0ACC3A9R3_9EURO|nr:hypothetical protein H2198_004061 [Knufia sp. JES_112]